MMSGYVTGNSAADCAGGLLNAALANSQEFSLVSLWDRRLEDLLSIRSLRDDWDGDGAEAPIPELMDTAIALLGWFRRSGHFPVPSRIVPSPNGTVVIEWESPDMYLEAEITTPSTVEWMEQKEGQEPQHYFIDVGQPAQTISGISIYRAA